MFKKILFHQFKFYNHKFVFNPTFLPLRFYYQQNEANKLKLMDFEEVLWPSVFKTIKNYFYAFLMKTYYDPHFSLQNFIEGSEQAVIVVSSLISEGKFESLKGLVTDEAIKEIKKNYNKLSLEQQKAIKVKPEDIFLKIVHEIGFIFDEEAEKNLVEVTTLMQGFQGLPSLKNQSISDIANHMNSRPNQLYVLNYRFFREFSKNSPDKGWIIKKLNHFNIKRHPVQAPPPSSSQQ